MKILLKLVHTHNYVRGVGSGTAIPEQALAFTELVAALDFALQYGLKDVRPVIRCDYSVAEVPPFRFECVVPGRGLNLNAG